LIVIQFIGPAWCRRQRITSHLTYEENSFVDAKNGDYRDARHVHILFYRRVVMQKPTDDFTRAPHLDPVRRYQAASHLGTAGFCSRRLRRIVILVGILVSGTAQAESLTGAALVATLRHGGCVILMRHASSPPAPPTVASAEPTNTKLERQLDETGRSSAQAMGEAIKTLTIPIGEVWSSPTYRAQETVRLADLPDPAVAAELGDGERSMQAIAKGQTIWLQAKAAERPRAGTNTIIVTQNPNIVGVFGQNASGLAEGEALVLRPTGTGDDEIVGRVKIQEWPSLASQG
jgi:phosphohistidine phosphatase SixA